MDFLALLGTAMVPESLSGERGFQTKGNSRVSVAVSVGVDV